MQNSLWCATLVAAAGSLRARPSSPAAMAEEKRLTLKFAYMKGNLAPSVISFLVRDSTPFAKVFKAWREKEGVSESGFRFLFEGEKMNPDDTCVSRHPLSPPQRPAERSLSLYAQAEDARYGGRRAGRRDARADGGQALSGHRRECVHVSADRTPSEGSVRPATISVCAADRRAARARTASAHPGSANELWYLHDNFPRPAQIQRARSAPALRPRCTRAYSSCETAAISATFAALICAICAGVNLGVRSMLTMPSHSFSTSVVCV